MSYHSVLRPSATRRTVEHADLLIEQGVPLVRKLAWHVHSRMSSAIEIEDLIQIGLIALIEAARNFEDRGFQFATYASMRIRGAMVDHLRKSSGELRSSSSARRAIALARKSVQERLGPAATDLDVASEMGLDPAAFVRLEASSASIQEVALDSVDADQDFAFRDPSPLADELLDDLHKEAGVRDAIAALPEREQLVLQLYFHEELNLDEIGAVLGVGAARVCQVKKAALARLRMALTKV